MIQRFCFVKLLDDEVGTRAELAEMLRAQLIAAGADVVVGLPADESAKRDSLSRAAWKRRNASAVKRCRA